MLIVPTCVPHIREDIAEAIENVKTFSHRIHIDIDDGIFVGAHSWPYGKAGEIGAIDLNGFGSTGIGVHLMVHEPEEIGILLAEAGVRTITSHVEAHQNPEEFAKTVATWREAGATEIGIAVRINTPIEAIYEFLPHCDFPLLMAIAHLGTQGHELDDRIYDRVRHLHEHSPRMVIAVDGGVNHDNIGDLVRAGAARFAVGAAITHNEDPAAAYQALKEAAEAAAISP